MEPNPVRRPAASTFAAAIMMACVTVGLAACLTAGGASAGVVDGRLNYTMIKLGAFQPTDELDDAGYDADFDFAVVYGRYLAENLVLEGSIGLFAADRDFEGSTRTTGTYRREDVIGASSLLVTLKGEFPVGPVRFYAGGGVGGYLVVLDSEVSTWAFGTVDVDDEDAVFGVHAVAGASIDVSPRWFIGLECQYRWTDDVELRKSVATIPIEYNGNLDGYAVTAGGGFRF